MGGGPAGWANAMGAIAVARNVKARSCARMGFLRFSDLLDNQPRPRLQGSGARPGSAVAGLFPLRARHRRDSLVIGSADQTGRERGPSMRANPQNTAILVIA